MKQSTPRQKTLLLGALVSTFALALSPAALARGPGGGDPGVDNPERAERRLQKMERMVRERLSPKLALDDATEDELVRLFQESAKERHAAMQVVKTERQALQALVDGKAGDAKLSAQLARVYAAIDKVPEKGSLLDKTAAVLTVEQQAKLVLSGPHGKHGKQGKRGKHGKRGKRGFGDGAAAGDVAPR